MNPRIVSDPQICGENLAFKEHVFRCRSSSAILQQEDHQTLLKQFPRLTQEDILACLEYAAFLATEKVAPA